jgi:hypothetical protein
MTSRKKKMPDFFEDNSYDPMETATGYTHAAPNETPGLFLDPNAGPLQQHGKSVADPVAKKKAGFYLSVHILDRFTRKFHELKLAGVPVDNKSTLLELVLAFALDDLDKGTRSQVLKILGS